MMKNLFIFLTLVLSQCKSYPLPAGQIIKYRVSSKYFNRLNDTSAAVTGENSNSLYNLLSQIHYGKTPMITTTTERGTTIVNELSTDDVTTAISNVNKNNVVNDDGDSDVTTVTETISNESPEEDDDVTTEQQILTTDAVKVNSNDDNLATTDVLIENDEVEKLSATTTSAIDVEKSTIISNENNIDSMDEENQNNIPETLLNAVGDLLSSVLGISFTNLDENDENEEEQEEKLVTDGNDSENDLTVTTTEVIPELNQETLEEEEKQAVTTENTVMSSNVDEIATMAALKDVDDQKMTTSVIATPDIVAVTDVNEVDLKIENLANVQTSFMTENTPEVYTERVAETDDTVKDIPSTTVKNENKNDEDDDDDDDEIVLETLSELVGIDTTDDDSDIRKEEEKPVSFEDSVNQVMNLVRGTEGNLALETAENIVDSVLIAQNMDESASDLDQIVYGTLKEIESNLGLNDASDKNLPTDSFNLVDHEREEMIKNFEMDINESLRRNNPEEEDYDVLDLEPNPVKAAMYYKFQYGDDF